MMIPLLKAQRYDLAIQKGVQGIVNGVAAPASWWRRHGDKVIFAVRGMYMCI